MSEAFISRRRGGSYITIKFEDFGLPIKKEAQELSVARTSLAATSVGDYALFGGGSTGSDRSSALDGYKSNLTHSTPTGLSAV